MKFVAWIRDVATSLLGVLTLSSHQYNPDQTVLAPVSAGLGSDVTSLSPDVSSFGPSGSKKGPVYYPPTGAYWDDFVCNYTRMGSDWEPCSTPENRGCWLRNKKTKKEFNITTNYEKEAPLGITRRYELDLRCGEINADGRRFSQGKFFNGSYNGPWLQACWGDTVEVKVTNLLTTNGTSIHWHGIRQLNTMQSDGVNGVTQCAIAPNDHFTYKWQALQYGSSWYHSHYSLQYADGATGQLTLHGPSSAPYDEAKFPLIMTDWSHDSAFRWAYLSPSFPSILLNGRGNVAQFSGNKNDANLPIPEPYTLNFTSEAESELGRPKRYLLRLINTSFETMFVFSIDNHNLTIVGADFVPIHPYSNTSVLIGIGQRYHVIVEANPNSGKSGPKVPEDGNFWIRTWVADGQGCGNPGKGKNYEQTGILRYNMSSTALPTSQAWPNISLACSDETYTSLVPVVPWDVKKPVNKAKKDDFGQNFNVTADHTQPYQYDHTFPLSFFALGEVPLRIDYGDPIFTHLSENKKWKTSWVVVPENYTADDWVWLVIQGATPFSEAHPIHLHGHDFAILRQVGDANFTGDISEFKLDNPPRRDVVLLPGRGYIAIAFKTDNPGSWLVHCHIAAHAASGLGMQILERQEDAAKLWPPGSESQLEAKRVCDNWNEWQSNPNNWWNSTINSPYSFQDDSGI